MGYVRATLKLVFADPELAGLEVRARRLSFGALLALSGLGGIKPTDPGAADRLAELYATLADALTGWNLEEPDGTPVPLTIEALADQDYPLIMAIVDALMDATSAVPPPLLQPSGDGSQSLEESLPMEVSSPSPSS